MKHFKKITLLNGLRVILAPQEGLATTVLVLVEAGSKYETKNINGLSHFLEHMCFKGTAKRPRAIDISAELDGIGAEYNAFTSQEWTGYFAKARNENLDTILDVICDLYLNPIFNPQEIEKEKGVIIEELNMYEDMPQRKVQDLFLELLYGDQPAGWNVGGQKEIIKKLTRGDFLAYRQKHYVASATSVIVAGSFNGEKVVRQIKKCFAGISAGKKSGKVKTRERQIKPAIMIKHKESDQTHLVLGCRAFDVFDKRRYALDVLADILGGGMSSRLFQKVREELGAAYYVGAGADLFSDHGFLGISAGVDHQKLSVVIKAILEELNKLKNGAVSEKEVRRAQDHLSGRLILALETSDELAMFYGGQEILKREMISPNELLKRIRSVKKDDILSVANYIFKNNKLNLALIGPHRDTKPFEKILRL
jgi:predicted Zn-dependent peptidase